MTDVYETAVLNSLYPSTVYETAVLNSLIHPLYIYHMDPHPYKTSKVLSSHIPLNYTSGSTKNVTQRSHFTDELTFRTCL